MNRDYVYAEDSLPEMGFVDIRPARSCATCGNTHVTNAGAVRPGLHCRIMEWLFKEKGIENGNASVGAGQCYTTCRFHELSIEKIKEILKKEKP